MKNVLKPLATSVSIPLGSTEVASTTDADIHKKMLTTTLITSNEEMNDIMKTIKSFEESSKMSQKNKKEEFSIVIRYIRC